MKDLKLVAIVGPTASGKSALAVKLAKRFNGIIISADSRQIYKGMDVGTTKIPKEERWGMPHYMLDVARPDDEFSVNLYQKSVMNLLDSLAHKNKRLKRPITPFLVGGTGLYVSAITDGWQFPSVPPNPKLRAQLDKKPLDGLVRQLVQLDPNTSVDIKNKRRVIRAIEILKSGQAKPTKTKPDFKVLKIGLGKDRNKTERLIKTRIEHLDIPALAQETKRLMKKGYNFDSPALSALGYKDVRDFINKKITKQELIQKLTRLHLQYAKRQMTWFKRDPNVCWVTSERQAEKLVANFLSK